jgi:hypothetical protein
VNGSGFMVRQSESASEPSLPAGARSTTSTKIDRKDAKKSRIKAFGALASLRSILVEAM